jgi:hypothetical protein
VHATFKSQSDEVANAPFTHNGIFHAINHLVKQHQMLSNGKFDCDEHITKNGNLSEKGNNTL